MLIDGEKWACEACVRGHRVSNCQHHDRPLQHINKKGRPVSQCQHCRSMRKSRASHVKCDCGEKTHKCIHLKTTVDGHKDSCCCNHGGRCTCSHKKEIPTLDTVPESDSDQDLAAQSKSSKSSSRSRRRANTTSSDGLLAFDAQGHHKPTYKHAKPSQKCGPYQLHRGNSLHSTSSAGDHSVDGLVHSGSYDGLSMPRRIRSEATSPLMTGSSFSQLNGQLPPLDLSGIKYPPYEPNSADFFGNISDYDVPLFSAGASVDWSHYEGLDFGRKADDFAPSNYSQAQSYGGYEYAASEQVPTLTTNTSTSGEVSEAEDILTNPLDDLTAQYRNPTTSSSYDMSYGQAGIQGTGELSLEFDDYSFMKSAPKFLTGRAPLTDEPALLGATLGFVGYTPPDHEAFWAEYPHGLPNYSTDSPTTDNNLASYWDDQ
ncbi:hypothetical protein B0T18DRAFT_330488 [Schizothecium vesticola]|uniref:Copper-fist domain-containing protein n=1 Tax=Schizothecium vesticola TaxID=314040 RepID=A0AA40K2Q2_9PEZI|nr:hypothetical protein B0T18DRAFT_330488 [Schizothecium vesticola]